MSIFIHVGIVWMALTTQVVQAQSWAFPPPTLREQAPSFQRSLVVPHPSGGYLGIAFHDYRISTTHFGKAVETHTETVENGPADLASAQMFQTGFLIKGNSKVSWFDFSGQRIWTRSGYSYQIAQADPDVILMHNERLLYGLSVEDGQTLWTSNTIGEDALRTSASVGEITYFSEESDGQRTLLKALNHQTGALIWRTNTGPARAISPVVTDECILVFTTNDDTASNQLECYSKVDGALLSNTEFDLPNVHISAVLQCDTTLVVFHGNVTSQTFGAIGLRAGKIVWRQNFTSDTRNALVAPDGSFYRFSYTVGTSDLLIERRRITDGEQNWNEPASLTHRMGGQYFAQASNVGVDLAAFGTNLQTGKPEWFVARIDASNGMSLNSTVIPSNALSRGNNGVAMSGNQIFSAEVLKVPPSDRLIVRAGNASTGVIQWQRQFDSLPVANEAPEISVGSDFLAVRTLSGEIFRLDRATGALIWRYRNPDLAGAKYARDLAYITLSRCLNCQEVQQLNADGNVQLTISNARAISTIERDVITVEGEQIVRRNPAGNVVWVLNYPTASIVNTIVDTNDDVYLLNRQFGQIVKVNGANGNIIWSQAYVPGSVSSITQRLVFLGDGTAFIRTTSGLISGSTRYFYFRIALINGELVGSILPPENIQRVFALPISEISDTFLAPAIGSPNFIPQNVLGRVNKGSLNWLGVQNYTSPSITDQISISRSDFFLSVAPNGGILVARNHFYESDTDESQIWLEHYPPPSDDLAGTLKVTQNNSGNNAFSDGIIQLRIQNNSDQIANNIAFSVGPLDRILGCRKSSGDSCNLRRDKLGSLRFDLAQNEYADFDFLSIVLPDCRIKITAQIQPAPDYVDTTVDDNRLEIPFCDRFISGFE